MCGNGSRDERTRGVRELFALIFQGLCITTMALLKLVIGMPRPEGSCSTTCGMPSGHSLEPLGAKPRRSMN